MKKIFLLTLIALGSFATMNAQEISKNALGLRLGDNDGFGGEISYQRGLGDNNRLELDLGWRNSNHIDAIKLAALYQWVWNIDGGFNWYVGAGGGLGSWSRDNDYYDDNDYDDSAAFAFVAGDIGIEYNFDIPLILSLDFRPELYFNSDDWRDNNLGPDLALGIRYQF
ncbi:hypothetical protein SAMN05216480_11567 [Pustulibacterium marinum]|uniref:Outer membrane protein beta-barrel domain-containing protein n=1 Tax=Pustulibacterium marinum TaxID=1224947 RepID=A0A1I7IEA0_9FLAO|nr:hypothetical protein [Pustulibacterium marinum]SFU71269.1 hypothetical protein SAMN05216480_11567 [Pustulibacterium marinum]